MDYSKITAIVDFLGIRQPERWILIDAGSLNSAHVPPFPIDWPVMIFGIVDSDLTKQVSSILESAYPSNHEIWLIEGSKINSIALVELRRRQTNSTSMDLFVPALAQGSSVEAFNEIVAHLRAPDGCPWDREQTHESLRTHLLEETYEALAAIDSGDFNAVREELGDLLLQIVLQAQIASEEGRFTIHHVVHDIHKKIIRRHPHVFGDLKLNGVEGVLANWEKLKEIEREIKKEGKGLLDGVPITLPALGQAQEYQDRAARVGFDWPAIEGVLDKVNEEVEEINRAENPQEAASELGDLLFVLVNLARWKKIDAESVLRQANARFKRRFAYIENSAMKMKKPLSELTLEEMDALWEVGKHLENNS
jgi:tetrapyrrole methylase family protein/MazG family protein